MALTPLPRSLFASLPRRRPFARPPPRSRPTPSGSVPNPERATLRVTNRDPSSALSLDCLHQPERSFWVSCESSVLEPGQSLDVPLCFAPRDARSYAFGVPFLVGGSYTVKVLVVGEGCPARLELSNPSQNHLSFGMVPEGQRVTKQVGDPGRARGGRRERRPGAGRLAGRRGAAARVSP